MNFVRVLIGAVFFPFFCTGEKSTLLMWGGDFHGVSLDVFAGYSLTAQCIGKPAYSEPKGKSSQEPVGGYLTRDFAALKRGGGLNSRATRPLPQTAAEKYTRHPTAAPSNQKDPNYETQEKRAIVAIMGFDASTLKCFSLPLQTKRIPLLHTKSFHRR